MHAALAVDDQEIEVLSRADEAPCGRGDPAQHVEGGGGAAMVAGMVAGKANAVDPCPPEIAPLLLDEHFSVDGTLVKAWASMKSSSRRQRPRRPMTLMTMAGQEIRPPSPTMPPNSPRPSR
jgi:hypothetical protein